MLLLVTKEPTRVDSTINVNARWRDLVTHFSCFITLKEIFLLNILKLMWGLNTKVGHLYLKKILVGEVSRKGIFQVLAA